MIENSTPFSRNLGIVPDIELALRRTMKIKPGEKITINLLIAISESKDKIWGGIPESMQKSC